MREDLFLYLRTGAGSSLKQSTRWSGSRLGGENFRNPALTEQSKYAPCSAMANPESSRFRVSIAYGFHGQRTWKTAAIVLMLCSVDYGILRYEGLPMLYGEM